MKNITLMYLVILVVSFIVMGCDDDTKNNANNNQTPDEICDNQVDDDGDGDVDCDDADCAADAACAANNVNNTNNQTSDTRNVDLMFVIDTSLSMQDHQTVLLGNLPNLVRTLAGTTGGLPNLHVGFITPDLGTAPYNVPGCELPGGDNGRYLKGESNSCVNPVGQTYLVDVAPAGCTVEKTDAEGEPTVCTAHDCVQANCDVAAFTDLEGVASEPAGLTLAVDENGCPRCRNYDGEPLSNVLACMSSLGTAGCGFEQPLEAMKLAITDWTGDNAWFLREDAYLAVVILTDEDDCSAQQPELFNPAGDVNSTLGTLTSFRCTEFGVVCDQEWERIMPQGSLTYTGCVPRPAGDPDAMLFPVTRYVEILEQLKAPGMLGSLVIAGPAGGTVSVGLDSNQNPILMASCGGGFEGAMPAVRLDGFAELVGDGTNSFGEFNSICESDYSPALESLATWLVDRMESAAR